jgi:hypothetical protein
MLRMRGWAVKRTHGNLYTEGWPDDYATHRRYGARWIEVKLPTRTGDPFTPAQHDTFRLFSKNGSGVWVLTGYSEKDYQLLFKPPNWWQYLPEFK